MTHIFKCELHTVSDGTIHIGADGNSCLLRVVDQIRHHIRKELAEGFRRVHDVLGCESSVLDDAGDRVRRLGSQGDPRIHAIKLQSSAFDALLRIVGAEDFKETAFLGEALVSSNNTEYGAAFGALLTETNNYGHGTGSGMGSGFGEVHGGDSGKEIKLFFPLFLRQGHASTPRITCPCTSVSRRSMPLL